MFPVGRDTMLKAQNRNARLVYCGRIPKIVFTKGAQMLIIRGMQKIFIAIIASAAAFASACSASSEKSANREYVKASANVVKAEQAFEKADYKTAKELCDEAVSIVHQIIENYPESAISLKVMTDPTTLIGPVTYRDLTSKVMPKLQQLNNSVSSDIGVLWPVIVNMGLGENVVDAAALAQISKDKGEISAETLKLIHSKLAAATENVEDKVRIENGDLSEYISRYINLSGLQPSGKALGAPKFKNSKKIPKAEKIADKAAFLSESRTQAAMVAYDINVIPVLHKKAVSAKASDEKTFEEFKKILDTALENVSKINAVQIRDKAYAGMSVLFADAGMENKAVEVARRVSDNKLFEDIFSKIADSAVNSENYMDAIALASRMPEGRQKNDFLAELAVGVAKRGYFEAAFSIIDSIKDASARDYSYAAIVVSAAGKNPKALAKAAAKINLENTSALEKISPLCAAIKERNKQSGNDCKAAALADFARMVGASDKALCQKINSAAIEALKDEKQIDPKIGNAIVRNLYDFSGPAEAVNFIYENAYKYSIIPIWQLCEISSAAAKSDPQTARKGFELAVGKCSGNDEILSVAWFVSLSKLPNESKVQIIKKYLPVFDK